MEWGLRKVLPDSSAETRSRFVQHIVPVILELTMVDVPEAELDAFRDILLAFFDRTVDDDPDEAHATE